MSTENHTPEPDAPEPDLTGFADLAVALEEGRPAPDPEFADRLDRAVADHFPREWSERSRDESRGGAFAALGRWMGARRRYLLPVNAGLAGLAVVVVAVGIGLDQGPGGETTTSENSTPATDFGAVDRNGDFERVRPADDGASATYGGGSSAAEPDPAGPAVPTDQAGSLQEFSGQAELERLIPGSRNVGPYAARADRRKIAQEARITLGTEPEDVQEVSNKIVGVVDEHEGIVLDSEVTDGPAGRAGAEFSLMIPSAGLESAVADLSGIADLRARNQQTEDITAPTLTVRDRLTTARARVESLVGQLAEATDDEERAEVEDELGQERRKAARLTTRLNNLERRANLTPVGVTVETGGDTGTDEDDSTWGLSDAADDAARMFGIAAGVALIALAIAIPVGILVLIALALNRAWVRRARNRALDEN
jgi:hypothetical protein